MGDPAEPTCRVWRDAARAARAQGLREQDVDDAAQNAVERLLRRSLTPSPALVRRIVANQRVSELRRAHVRSRTLPLLESRALRTLIAAGPPRLDVREEYELTVSIAANVLSKSDLALMLMVDRDEVPLREAARRLGLPVSTVSDRLKRARIAVQRARTAHLDGLRHDSRRAS